MQNDNKLLRIIQNNQKAASLPRAVGIQRKIVISFNSKCQVLDQIQYQKTAESVYYPKFINRYVFQDLR